MRLYTNSVTWLISFLLILGLNQAQALQASNVADAIKKIDSAIQSSVQKKQIPGCAIAIVYRNQVVFMQGYGVRAIGKTEKIDADTLFQLGSLSKPVAATLMSVLERRGLLDLDDPVKDHLPHFTLNTAQHPKSLKIKNVLSHTSGVPRGGFNSLIESYAPYSKILKTLQTTKVKAPIGKKYDYHNAMYGLLGEITQAATQQSFPLALSTHLLRPLNMTRTTATFEGLIHSANRAYPHTRAGKKGGHNACHSYSQGYYAVAPAGGINSSARDMAEFLKAQMGGYPEVIPHHALAEIHTPYVATQNTLSASRIKNPSYGLGWRILELDDNKLVYHGGWLKGFTNFMAFMPEHKLGIVVLHNAETKFSSKTVVQFFETALGLPETKAVVAPVKKPKAAKRAKVKAKKKITVASAKAK